MPQIERKKGKLYIDGIKQPDDCFGIFWAAIGDEPCCECVFKDHCLDNFARTTLVAAQKKIGEFGDALMEELQLPKEAVLIATNHQATHGIETGFGEEEEPIPEQEPPKTTKKKKKKKATKKAAAKEETPKKRRPPKAGPSAKRAKGPAGQTKGKKKRAPSAKARAGSSLDKRRVRWERERKRNKVVGLLVPGNVLRRQWKGSVAMVKVHDGYYEYNGEKFATLYDVTGEITGWRPYRKQRRNGSRPQGTRVMSAWSPSRFWKFKQLEAQLKK